jgi:hypothetical protein
LVELADEHRRWLRQFDPRHLRNWERSFKHDYEAAMSEAAVRRTLEEYGLTVSPNENVAAGTGGPDFRCGLDGRHFYVEVACMSIKKLEVALFGKKKKKKGKRNKDRSAEAKTPKKKRRKPSLIRPWRPFGVIEAVFQKCMKKAKQFVRADGPVLLAGATWHSEGMTFTRDHVRFVLTGETQMAWSLNVDTQETSDAYHLTKLRNAFCFLELKEGRREVEIAHPQIAGVLLCPVNFPSMSPIGVLHPQATHSFDPGFLPNVDFAQVEYDPLKRQLHVHWPQGAAAG